MANAEPGAAISVPVAIDREEVLDFLGYPQNVRPPERIESLLEDILLEARALTHACGTYQRLAAANAKDLELEPIDAAEVVIGLVTIGAGIETRASALQRAGHATRALILDAAGSAAAEEAADRLGTIIAGDDAWTTSTGADRRFHPSCRISPGYGQWPLTAQARIFSMLPHQTVGIALLPSMLMVPRKSISFAMWMGANQRPIAGLSGCTRCDLPHCRYRRKPREENT